MPAHGAQCSIGRALMSNRVPISPIHWRANRLVDLLAKSVARPWRIKEDDRATIKDAEDTIAYSLAFLGAVTHAANHHKASVTRRDGSSYSATIRDSAGSKPVRMPS